MGFSPENAAITRMKKTPLLLVSLLLLSAVGINAQEVVILENTGRNFDRSATTSHGRERVLNEISRETQVPVATLKDQRKHTHLGYGGLFIANSLASATGKTFDEIAALKASGHGWGWIAKQNNVKLGPIVSRAHHVDKAIKKDHTKNATVAKTKKSKKAKKEKLYGKGHGSKHGHKNTYAYNASPHLQANSHPHGHGKGH